MNTITKTTKGGYVKLTEEQWDAKRKFKLDIIKAKKELVRLGREVAFKEAIVKFKGTYKLIPENTDYYCLSDGRVWSIKRARFLKPANHTLGYLFIGKFKINGKKKLALLHQIVAHTFIPNPEKLPELNHKDGNKHNCSVKNLEWVTRQQNMRHAWDNGMMEDARKNLRDSKGNAKLTESQVREIRKCFESNSKTVKELASFYNVHIGTIYRIANLRRWAKLK